MDQSQLVITVISIIIIVVIAWKVERQNKK